jgi:DNA mismatch repair protein MSH5
MQSAFMIDLNQISFALRNATTRSVLILDEFGKGTLATGQMHSISPFRSEFY